MKKSLKITLSVGILLAVLGLAACKRYLDRPLEASISEKDVFTNFRSFQGFTEELYNCLPDMSKPTWNGEWNTGDDILSTTNATYRLNAEFDNGNYRAWQTGCGGANWTYWQVSSTGAICGISGNCDLDAYPLSVSELISYQGVK